MTDMWGRAECRLLGHTQVQTTAQYAHLKTDPIRNMADKIAMTIASAFLAA